MSTIKPWCDEHKALAREHKVAHLLLVTTSFGDHETAEFLLEMPWLTGLKISLYSAKDLTAVGRLQELKSLRLHFSVLQLGDRFMPVDFSGLRKINHVDVMMCHAFEAILACNTIEKLAVCNDWDRRLRDLDLSLLPKLRELRLDHCPKLRRVIFHPGLASGRWSYRVAGHIRPIGIGSARTFVHSFWAAGSNSLWRTS